MKTKRYDLAYFLRAKQRFDELGQEIMREARGVADCAVTSEDLDVSEGALASMYTTMLARERAFRDAMQAFADIIAVEPAVGILDPLCGPRADAAMQAAERYLETLRCIRRAIDATRARLAAQSAITVASLKARCSK
ncbi:MAG: hypothetical protein IT521_02425 [Burkholderiales bacterium]|nr:hypothetical protein [Burkholderiales bacterium]